MGDIVRQEVQVLKSDFNGRLKQVLFNAMVRTYYAAFVPCCFAPSALNYETAWVFRWNASTVWPYGSFVRHGKELYKAECQHNCAEPGNSTQSRFYSFFSDPVHVLGVFLMVQSGLVLAQHLSLAWSSSW